MNLYLTTTNFAIYTGLLLTEELGPLMEQVGIPEQEWNSFFVVADGHLLSNCSGLVLIANADVRQAVYNRYLKTDHIRIKFHDDIAKFFASKPDLTDRKVEELPYQLDKSMSWDNLRELLCDMNFFDKLYTESHKLIFSNTGSTLNNTAQAIQLVATPLLLVANSSHQA